MAPIIQAGEAGVLLKGAQQIAVRRLTDMTQELMQESVVSDAGGEPHSGSSGWGSDDFGGDFDYTPVSPWGPAAAVMAVFGLTAFLGLFGIVVAAAASVVSLAAIVRIRGAQGTVRGMLAAVLGLLISMSSVAGGIASQIYHYNHEVPEGYLRVNFPNDISSRQFRYYAGNQRRLHPEVAKLIGKKIFIKGFMWLSQREHDLTSFVLLKDNGECCFGGKPKPWDMIRVDMKDGLTVDGHTGLVAVAGVLSANVAAGEDEAVYSIEAVLVEPARTRF